MEETNNKKMIVQRLKKTASDSYAVGQKYYDIISCINNLGLQKREIELLDFTAIKGNIAYTNLRQEFCDKYETSVGTINNMISKLKKSGILVKDGNRIKVNPLISLNFENDVVLQITIAHG
jgi:hypothetical protein